VRDLQRVIDPLQIALGPAALGANLTALQKAWHTTYS
jgi:hypothetical protein